MKRTTVLLISRCTNMDNTVNIDDMSRAYPFDYRTGLARAVKSKSYVWENATEKFIIIDHLEQFTRNEARIIGLNWKHGRVFRYNWNTEEFE